MKNYRVDVRRYPNDPMPIGVEVWDLTENERVETYERKFKNPMLAYVYASRLRNKFISPFPMCDCGHESPDHKQSGCDSCRACDCPSFRDCGEDA